MVTLIARSSGVKALSFVGCGDWAIANVKAIRSRRPSAVKEYRWVRLRCCDSAIQPLMVLTILLVPGSTGFLLSVADSFALSDCFRLMILIALIISQKIDAC